MFEEIRPPARPATLSRRRTVAGASDLSREVRFARKAAIEAGKILKAYYRGSYQIGSKGHDSPVTTADLEADRAIREILTRAFPAYGWLSEESADSTERLGRSRVWIVDPLDGTKEFIRKIPEFCVAIALAERGVPVVGVIYNPVRREMCWAARGMGCYLGGRRVRVTRTRVLRRARVLASRSETARGEWQPFERAMVVVATGSVAYKLAMVAAGKADATFTRLPKNEWDVGAGAALIAEAGGMITDIAGRPLRFNRRKPRFAGVVASNLILHSALIETASHPAPDRRADRPRLAHSAGERLQPHRPVH